MVQVIFYYTPKKQLLSKTPFTLDKHACEHAREHACGSVNSTVKIHGIILVCGCSRACSRARSRARSRAKKAREHARELFQKNEHVHSFQNAREHARELFYF